MGLQDRGPGAIGGVFTAHRPSQPWLPGEAGRRARGQEGGRKEGPRDPQPQPKRGRRQKGPGPHSQHPSCLPHPSPQTSSHPEPGAASEATPLAGDRGAKGLVSQALGAQARPPALLPLPNPRWLAESACGSSYGQAGGGACGSYRGGHRQWEEGSGGCSDRQGEARLGLPPGARPSDPLLS